MSNGHECADITCTNTHEMPCISRPLTPVTSWLCPADVSVMALREKSDLPTFVLCELKGNSRKHELCKCIFTLLLFIWLVKYYGTDKKRKEKSRWEVQKADVRYK